MTNLKESAEQGDADDQLKLGYAYYFGQGFEQDYAEAVTWFCKSAQQGNATSQYSLAYAYTPVLMQGKAMDLSLCCRASSKHCQ